MAFCGSKLQNQLKVSLTLVPKSPESRLFPLHTHQIKGCSPMVSQRQQGLEARCVAGTLLSALCGTHRHHNSLDETPAIDHGETVRVPFPTLSSYFGLSTLMPVRRLLKYRWV